MACQGRHIGFEANLEFLFVPFPAPKTGGFHGMRLSEVVCTACGEKFRFAERGDIPPLDAKGGVSFLGADGATLTIAYSLIAAAKKGGR